MDRRRSDEPGSTGDTRPLREPVRLPWLWVAMGLVVLAGVPWYLPAGAIEPLVGGIPFWLLISVVATVAFSAVTCWGCARGWNLAEPAEESAASGRRDEEVHP